MAEYAVVEVLVLEALLDVDDDAFAVIAEVVHGILAGVLHFVGVAPAVGEAESEG